MQESENSHDQQDAEETAGSVQETYDYLLESGDYNNYTSDWMAAPEFYSILDINQDQIPELMIHSAGIPAGQIHFFMPMIPTARQ